MIKKIILLISIFFMLTGCTDVKDNVNKEISDLDDMSEINEEDTSLQYIDDNPIKVALYEDGYKVKSYHTTLANFKDIGVFDVYFTDIDKVDSSNTKVNYQKYLNEYEDISNYKTGFYITFIAEDSLIEQVILDPSAQHAMTPYLYVYLYDDVNQTAGSYYSHLEPDDMKENTVISSIKLFLAQQGVKISSPITLTVFTYDGDDDFDENGLYRGKSSYTVTIDIN